MAKQFVDAVSTYFARQESKWLILGDPEHGLTSLRSLATAVNQGTLKLKELGVQAVLFEGVRKGQEATHENGRFNGAVTALRKQVKIVVGCEDDKSLTTEAAAIEMLANPEGVTNMAAQTQAMFDRRVGDANDAWAGSLLQYSRAILCCGSSHLPHFDSGQGVSDLGLVKRMGFKGTTAGYIVGTPNNGADNDLYYPEWNGQGVKRFGAVEAIQPYPGANPGI